LPKNNLMSKKNRYKDEEKKMAKCPKCGAEVTRPLKEWDLSKKVHVKLYQHCGKKFREYVRK